MAPLLSHNNGMGDVLDGIAPNSCMNFFIHTASLAASLAAMYSASVVESAVDPCLLFFQQTAHDPIVKTYPDVDFLSSGSDWKSASVYLRICSKLPSNTRQNSFVLRRYLICFSQQSNALALGWPEICLLHSLPELCQDECTAWHT